MKVLDLFSGLGGATHAFKDRGHDVVTLDHEAKFEPDICADILDVTVAQLQKHGPFDFAWASPPCQRFSVMTIGKNWEDPDTPKTGAARVAQAIVQHTLYLLNRIDTRAWIMENPVGMLRAQRFMRGIERRTLTYCLAGSTKVVTRGGMRHISSLCDTAPELLTRGGRWVSAPVRCYGESPVQEIQLVRVGQAKTVLATPQHEWLVVVVHRGVERSRTVKTPDLLPGDRLAHCVPTNAAARDTDPHSVARGFVYGDGYVLPALPKLRRERAYAQFCGAKDRAMLPFFDGLGGKRMLDKRSGCIRIQPLPPEWKKEPPAPTDHPKVIVGWLSGYFAADGTVSRAGQTIMCSAREDNIDTFRALGRAVGIGTREPTCRMRSGFGGPKTALWSVTLDRGTLWPGFFHLSHHRERFTALAPPVHSPKRWTVEGVGTPRDAQPVYCADVPVEHAFVVEGDILTHNCQYGFPYRKATDLWGGFPPTLQLRAPCKPNRSGHAAAPAGSRLGVQGVGEPEEPCHAAAPRSVAGGKTGRKNGFDPVRDVSMDDLRVAFAEGYDPHAKRIPKRYQTREKAALRALVPYELSLEVCLAMEAWSGASCRRPTLAEFAEAP